MFPTLFYFLNSFEGGQDDVAGMKINVLSVSYFCFSMTAGEMIQAQNEAAGM